MKLRNKAAFMATLLMLGTSIATAADVTLHIDTRTGVRTARAMEPIAFSTAWNSASALSLALDGNALLSVDYATNGIMPIALADWTVPGLYTLTHDDGVSVMTAQFLVTHADFSSVYAEAIGSDNTSWTTGDGTEWRLIDGVEAGIRSAPIPDGTNSWMETTVTGPGIFSFEWRVSCENRYAYLQFLIDGTQKKRISNNTSWAELSYDIPAGEHTLRWNYVKAGADAVGEDAGFVRNVSWRPEVGLSIASPHGTPSPSGASTLHYGDQVDAAVDASVTDGTIRYDCIGWAATGSAPESGTSNTVAFAIREDTAIDWLWRTNYWTEIAVSGPATCALGGEWIAAESATSVAIAPTVPYYSIALSGDTDGVSLVGTNIVFTADRARSIAATVTELTLESALDAAGAAWRTDGGAAAWFPQDATTHDGVDAAHSGDIGGKGESAIEATFVGPGTLGFQWKLAMGGSNAGIDLIVDGDVVDGLNDETDWTAYELALDGGRHVVRWEFWRAEGGSPAAFLDEIVWSGTYPAPCETSVSVVGPATADFSEGLLPDATEKTVTITPSVPYYMVALGGDTDGVTLDGLTLSFVADQDRAIVVTVTELTFASVLEAPGLEWSTGGDADWFPQEVESADGVDAAQSGAVSGKGSTWIGTTVTGPGTITFRWKLDRDGLAAGIDLLVDGEYADGLVDDTPWTEYTCEIDEGEHEISWEFWRPAGEVGGTAWLDQVVWSGSSVSTATSTTPVPVPYAWLRERGLAAQDASESAYEVVANATAANGENSVWECYVAGLDPTDADDYLLAQITIVDDEPIITWTPERLETTPADWYIVEGKASLTDPDEEWVPQNATHRFFRVRIEIPE